jgi:predicted dehydrogenase
MQTRDPYIYFARIIRGDIELAPDDLSSLENNMIVVEILDAARESAQTQKAVHLSSD